MYQCILFSASWALTKKFKGRLYPHWSMGTQYPIEFFLKDTIHLCVFSSLRSWRYCVVVEWDLAAEPLWYSRVIFDGGAVTSGKAARNTASSLLPFFGTRLRRQNFNLAPTQYRQLRRLCFSFTDPPFLLFATVYSVTVSIMAFSNCDSLNCWGVHRKILFCLIN